MTSSKALFWFCIFFIVGVSIQSLLYNWGQKHPIFYLVKEQYPVISVFAFGILIVIISLFLKNNNFMILGFCFLFLVLGVVRFQIAELDIEKDELKKLNDKPEKISLVGKIVAEPDVRDNFQKLKVRVSQSNVLITVGRYPEYKYLDKIKITGKLETPIVTEDFNYKNYLLKDKIYSVMNFPKTELVSKEHEYNIFSFSLGKILFFKEKLEKSINSNFTWPQNLVLKGIVLGDVSNMPKSLKDKFSATGLTHLMAVSGGNIVVLSTILMSFLLFLGLWRQQAFYLSIIFAWLYIVLVGFPASGVRAALMANCLLFAQILGRQNTSLRTIILAAALMILQNPLILLYDIGFQLSFLASMGIIYLKPMADIFFTSASTKFFLANRSKISDYIKGKFKDLFDIVSVTLAAQIFTLPIIAYNFASLSLVAPITNLLILPIVPFLMSFGLLTAVLGIFSNFLGWVFYLPCWLLLTYFLKVTDIFYQSWVVKTIDNAPLIWLAVYYSALFVLIRFLSRKLKPNFKMPESIV